MDRSVVGNIANRGARRVCAFILRAESHSAPVVCNAIITRKPFRHSSSFTVPDSKRLHADAPFARYICRFVSKAREAEDSSRFDGHTLSVRHPYGAFQFRQPSRKRDPVNQRFGKAHLSGETTSKRVSVGRSVLNITRFSTPLEHPVVLFFVSSFSKSVLFLFGAGIGSCESSIATLMKNDGTRREKKILNHWSVRVGPDWQAFSHPRRAILGILKLETIEAHRSMVDSFN